MNILESPITALVCSFISKTELESYLAARPHMRIIGRLIYPLARLGEQVVLIEQHISAESATKARKDRLASDKTRRKLKIKSNNQAQAARKGQAMENLIHSKYYSSLIG